MNKLERHQMNLDRIREALHDAGARPIEHFTIDLGARPGGPQNKLHVQTYWHPRKGLTMIYRRSDGSLLEVLATVEQGNSMEDTLKWISS